MIPQLTPVTQTGGVNARSCQAIQSAIDRLVDRKHRVIQLFEPPFDKSLPSPGYIQGYTPGVRENGGQYTHAAMWMIQASALVGNGSQAMKLFDMANPILSSRSKRLASRYKLEPYVVAADVYANEKHAGRGGWSWYTGSAAWMYRVASEDLLGIKIEGDMLTVSPCLPKDWTSYAFVLKRDSTTWNVSVDLANSKEAICSNTLRLINDGRTHDVQLSAAKSEPEA